jgi:hypothetical protein
MSMIPAMLLEQRLCCHSLVASEREAVAPRGLVRFEDNAFGIVLQMTDISGTFEQQKPAI